MVDYDDDWFQIALYMQKKLQQKLFPDLEQKTVNERMLVNTHALMHEVMEVERELNWKHWKKDKLINWDAVKDEIADEMIFLMNQINIMGMSSEDIIKRVIDKMDTNVSRQMHGY